MDSIKAEPTTVCHVVAMPYPGRGHINPMMNFCKSLASTKKDILITFVVTEEWLGFICSDPKPDNICFASIPNVVPSELVRAADLHSFFEATMTKMEAPFERLLDRLEPLPTVIVADTHMFWTVAVGNRRNIPVASFWPMSASVFTVLQHFDLFAHNGHFPVDILEKGNERVDYIPGISSSIRLADIPFLIGASHWVSEAFSWVPKAQYLLFTSIYELESQAIDVIKAKLSIPVYTIGPTIPFFNLEDDSSSLFADNNDLNYLHWLDSQPKTSVLYISMGSFLSVSRHQMNEIAAGLRDSSARFLCVARDVETSSLEVACGDKGLVVPWCHQLRVLSHSSVGGFWSHCGWNSTREGVFCGVPFLTFPILGDQKQNSKVIVEDWKVGWRMKKEVEVENLVTREEIAVLVKKFMDLANDEVKEMRRRASKFQQICQQAIGRGGSFETNINAFVQDLSQVLGDN